MVAVMAPLARLDGLMFTGGIGEYAPEIPAAQLRSPLLARHQQRYGRNCAGRTTHRSEGAARSMY
ncbi:hypothetical protein [Bradyrhizobium sp. USDA 3256]